MNLSIMQPYLFPYIGYFQLIRVSDVFVVYDDVHYIKGGWINRNKIISNKSTDPHFFTLSLVKKSSNKQINEISIYEDSMESNRRKIINKIKNAYSKAPQFDFVFPLIEGIILNRENSLSEYIKYSLEAVSRYIGINTEFINSSSIVKNNVLRGSERILDICNRMDVDQYINLVGGKILYNKDQFKKKCVKLSFIRSREIKYKQFNNNFAPNLSIVDILMFCPIDLIYGFLDNFVLE